MMKQTEDNVVENETAEDVPEADAPEAPAEDAVEEEAKDEKSSEAPEDGPEAKLAATQDRLIRLQADFDNFRKRTLRERQETLRRATDNVMLELLPVLDHFDLALKAAADHDADEQLIEGFKLVENQISGALEKFGLSPIEAEGQDFDHNLHEAISRLPSEEIAEGKVLSQTRKGYKSGDRLLRAAQVVVSSGSPESTGDAKADTESSNDKD